MQAQSAFKLGCAALRSDVAALSAVHQSLAELLGSEHAAAATGDSPEVSGLRYLPAHKHSVEPTMTAACSKASPQVM